MGIGLDRYAVEKLSWTVKFWLNEATLQNIVVREEISFLDFT